jgi:hypothetical protein
LNFLPYFFTGICSGCGADGSLIVVNPNLCASCLANKHRPVTPPEQLTLFDMTSIAPQALGHIMVDKRLPIMISDVIHTIDQAERLGHNIVFHGGHVCLYCRQPLDSIAPGSSCAPDLYV